MGKLVYIKTGQAVTGGQSAPSSGRGLMHLDGTPVERKSGTQTVKAKETKAVTPSSSPRPMENASTGNNRPNSRLLADVQTGGTTPPSLDNGRVGKVISGAAKSTGSAFTNLGGLLAEGAGYLNTRIANQNAGASLQSDHDAVKRYEKMLRDVKWANGKAMTAADVKQVQGYLAAAKRRISAHEGYTKAVEQSDKAVADKAYQKADRLSQSSAADVAQAKEGLGPVGQFAVDVGVAGAQMAGDMAVGALTGGSALPAMFVRSVGSAAQEARQSGATYGQQLGYGLGSGALSVATEKISNVADPFKKFFGEGLADKAAGKLIARFGESDAVRIMKRLAETPGGKAALSFISEGGEEAIEDIAQPILQTIYNGKRYSTVPEYIRDLDAKEIAHDALVGGALGLVGSAVENVQRGSGQADAQPTQETRPEVQEGTYTPSPANAAEGTQNAAPVVGTAENIRVGQVTTIKKPYKGEVPTQTQRQNTAPVQVSSEALTQAQNSIAGARGLESSFPVQSFKSTLKNAYKSIFKPAKGVVVDGTSFGGQPYAVDINNNVPGKVISDVNLTAEKLSLLSNLPDVVRNGTYVGSGEYTQHSGRNRPGVRYDYFETPVQINGTDYIAKFDVEVLPGANNYRTHQVVKMDLTPTEARLAGPSPVPSSAASSPVEGTRPLNANDSIAQGAENVKNGESRDILSEVLFGKKRADLNTMTEAQQDAIFRANEEGTVGMDATGKVFQIDPEQHIDRRRMETVGGRDVNAFQFDHPELHHYYQEAANALIADADLSLQQPMSRRYERTMEGNAVQQAAQTSPHLRQAMDETGLTRDSIIDAAKRIVQDSGQENVAAAKRVELILDDMLSHGYTTMTGEQVGPNSGYLTAKQGILGAGEAQARGHGLDGVDGYDNLGSARQGFTTPGMEGTEQTSRLADSLPYDRYQESATGLTREDYAKLFRYESQTEGKSLHLAEELVYVKKDGQKTFLRDVDEGAFHELVRSLDDATAWNAPQMDAARMIQRELQGKADGLEIPETEYIDFLKIMREHETSTGQGVQANAKWSRKDNNGGQASELDAWDNLERSNLSDAEKTETFRQIVKWDTDIEAVKSGDTAAMKDIILDVAEARGVLNGVTGNESKALRSIAESSLNALTFDQLKQFAYASTSAMSTDATSANLGRKIKTIQILNMLSNPKTASKNVTGNTSFYALDALSMKGGALLDMAVSKLTGTRSMAADSVFSKGTREAAVKAMRMSIAEITMDVDMGGTNTRYGTGSQRTFKANGNFAERVISALERNQAYLLNATDEFYKGAARASEANTQRLIDEGKIKTADKDYAKTQAEQLAKYRTFQDDSKMSVIIQEIHDLFNMVGIGDSGKTIKGKTVHSFGAGDIVAPFTRVAGNLVSRGIEYSPINAMKGTVEIAEAVAKAANNGSADVELQAKGVSNAARGLTGTAIAFGFMNLVKMGLMRKADDEDDEKVAALNRAEGMTGTQLNLSAAKRWLSGGGTEWQYGDTLIDLSSVEPLNLLMDLGAEMAKSEGKPVVSTFKATGKSFMSASADLPVAQFIGNVGTDVLKYNNDPMESIIKEGASTVASSLTPNVLRAVAQGLDDRPRATGYADTFTERLAMEAKSRIPGLRETLPGSVDTLGNERMYQGTTPERLFNSMLNPVGVNHYQQGELSKELESLRERSGGNTSFYPTNRIPKEISFTDKNGKEHTAQMDYEQRQDFQRTRGTVTNGTMMAMTGTRAYQKASAERQVELMAKCQSYGYEVAKGSVLGKDSMEKWAVNAQTSKKDVGLSTVEFLNLYTDDRYKSYLVGKAYEKTKEAYRAGVSVEEYVGLKESADTDGNGTISKAEASAALAGQENRADLWSLLCTTGAKNPYK